MASSELSLNDFVVALAEQERQDTQEHPVAEGLVAYHAGDLDDAAAERIQEHLGICPDCAQMVLALDAFTDDDLLANDDRAAADEEADWAVIEARLLQDGTVRPADVAAFRSPSLEPAPVPELPQHTQPTLYNWRALAATLAFVCLGLSIWVAVLSQRTPANPVELRTNIHAVDLLTQERIERQGFPDGQLEIPGGADYVLFFLNGADSGRFADYGVELRRDDGELLWTADGVYRAPEGNFTVEIPRTALRPGRYKLRIEGLNAEGPALLATYSFEIADDPTARVDR